MPRKRFLSAIAIVPIVFFGGCWGHDDMASLPSFELTARRNGIVENHPPKKVSQMAGNDILVAVNGLPLTRTLFDNILLMRAEGLKKEKLAGQELNKRLEEFARGYVSNFVAQRLMVDAAFREGVVTTNEVEAHVAEQLSKIAEKHKETLEQLNASFGSFSRYYRYEIAISYIMERYVKEKIPPVVKVDEGFVKAVKDQILSENAAARGTNAQIKVQMANWRKEILSGKLDFATVAAEHPPKTDGDTTGGRWGVFEKRDFDDDSVAEAAFGLKVNEVSEVIDTDEFYYILKLLSVKPAEKDKAGNILAEERREIAAIMFAKVPIAIEDPDDVLTKDLEGQMQVQAVNAYLTNLLTNGVNTVIYPNGKKLF